MKRVLNIICALICLVPTLTLNSCMPPQTIIPVMGSGDVEDKNYTVADFHSIEVSGGFDVTLAQGNSEDVTLTAQENLFEYITVKVEAGILKIYTEHNIMATKSMKAVITLKNIDNLKVSGGGDVITKTPLNAAQLGFEISGGGDVTATINTNVMNCNISGGGDAKFDGTMATSIQCRISGGGDIFVRNGQKAADVDIEINGGGDMDLQTDADIMKCSISGGGDATLSGKAGQLDIVLSGGGDITASGFAAEVISFRASGGSDVHVQATRQLTGEISGGGNLYYSGGAESVNVDARGGSKILRE